MKVVNLRFDSALYGQPARKLKPSSGKSQFGKLTWNELHSLALMLLQQRTELDYGLKYAAGGPKSCMYSVETYPFKKVLFVGREWVAPGQEDTLETAYQGLVRLGEVSQKQASPVHNFYRFRREDGRIISAFESNYIENGYPNFLLDTPMDPENFMSGSDPLNRNYDLEIVGAFLGVMLSNYRALRGSLPSFRLDSGDVKGKSFGFVNVPTTYAFTFVWCDGIHAVPRERLAEFLVEQIAPERIFTGTRLHERRDEFVQLINEQTAKFLAA